MSLLLRLLSHALLLLPLCNCHCCHRGITAAPTAHSLSSSTGPRFRRLNAAVASLLDEYSLVSFVPLDISDEDSIGDVLLQVRMCVRNEVDRCVSVCYGGWGAVLSLAQWMWLLRVWPSLWVGSLMPLPWGFLGGTDIYVLR